MTTSTAGRAAGEPRTAFVLAGGAALGAMQALEEQPGRAPRGSLSGSARSGPAVSRTCALS